MSWLPLDLSLREGDGTPLQYSCLENPMDRGAWKAAVHGVAKSQTPLRDFTFTFHFHALEKEMATHSSALAWRIPGTGEPGRLLSMGSHRVGHDWSDLAAATVDLTRKCDKNYSYILFIDSGWKYRLKLNSSSVISWLCNTSQVIYRNIETGWGNLLKYFLTVLGTN